ncbi:MAG: alpha/beta fold hydrolase, partial [Alphaproteobacteria bacterium]
PAPVGTKVVAQALRAHENATLVDLPGGRSLGYYILGPAIGRPVVVINSPTQALLPHEGILNRLARLNICLVAIQRPGFGKASAQPEMTFDSFVEDMPHLLAALQKRFMCNSFPILGLASGAPFALAAAAGFGDGASALGLSSPRLNVDTSNRNRPLGDAVLFLHAMKAGWALDFTFSILKTRLGDETIGRVIDRVFAASAVDVALLGAHPALRQSIIAAAREGFNASAATMANETRLLRDGYAADWDTFPAPIIVWQGGQDQVNPLGHDRASFGNMPLAELRLFPDSGHLLLEHHLETMLADLLALAERSIEK